MCNVNGNLSTASTITYGVPQGSILGPLRFLMYINDLPSCLQNFSSRMFAYDTNISLTSKTLTELKLEINPKLSNLNRWPKANKLSLNVAKTELMIIGSRQRLHTQSDKIDIEIRWRESQEGWSYQIIRAYHWWSTLLVETRWRNIQESLLIYRRFKTSMALYFHEYCSANLQCPNSTTPRLLQPHLGLFEQSVKR